MHNQCLETDRLPELLLQDGEHVQILDCSVHLVNFCHEVRNAHLFSHHLSVARWPFARTFAVFLLASEIVLVVDVPLALMQFIKITGQVLFAHSLQEFVRLHECSDKLLSGL